MDPYLVFAAFVGVGLATWNFDPQLRLALLRLVLLAGVLLYADRRQLPVDYSLSKVIQGLAIGALVGLPFVLFAPSFFGATGERFYGSKDLFVLVERAVFITPLVEALFFRGFLQREKGLTAAAALFGLAQGIYVITGAAMYWAVLLTLMVATGLLGLIYGYVAERYGLAASAACQAAANFLLLGLPPILQRFGALFP
ncbi:MAG: CPBP family intramembrane metalloprotease [Chloroflexi bacterium]|nr:CPBP family intramembrane metalloprotease [Chloroflexota bacterium]